MTKHETREYAFLLLYEAMVRAEELTTIEDLYASTEEMLELPVPEKVKQYVSGVMSQTEELDNIISEYSKQRSLNCANHPYPLEELRSAMRRYYFDQADEKSTSLSTL